jgi:hypothetical protein
MEFAVEFFMKSALYLLALLLGLLQRALYRSEPCGWHEIDWSHKLGRLVMITVTLALFIGPALWFLLR